MSDKILKAKVVDEMKKDYLNYSIMVNRSRQIPDIRDGLKTVHRRILHIMFHEIKCKVNITVKSARTVGDVLGKAHPHGDSSVYNAMKAMLNDFEIKVPLLLGQGNFGTIAGDTQAAMRYTEATLSQFSMDCFFSELKESKDVVDWINNFDDSTIEPEYLPVKVPLLLINGSLGIGFGMKVDIPNHNLVEVINETIKLIKNPKHKVKLIPDHKMPVEIIDTDFEAISRLGRGRYTARGIIDIEEDGKGNSILIIKSLPDQVFLNTVIESLEKLAASNTIPIADLDDESDTNTPVRYVIRLKKGVPAEYARDMIYKKTRMSSTYSINFEALDKRTPIRLSYKSYLQSFIDNRKVCKFRLYHNKLRDAKTDYHEKEAYIKALESGEIDTIISMIRKRKTDDDHDLIEYLIKKLDITDFQAKYIINAGLKKLSLGYLERLKSESKHLTDQIQNYTQMMMDESYLEREILEELEYFKKTYGTPRTSRVVSEESTNSIPQGNFKIIVTENNNIKKLPEGSANGSFRNDKPKFIIDMENKDGLLLFDDKGKVFNMPIHQIPISDKTGNGVDVRILIKNCTANIIKAIPVSTIEEMAKKKSKFFMTTLSNSGNIKKMDLDDFVRIPTSGMLYMKLGGNEFVKSICISRSNIDMIVFDNQKAIRIGVKDIPHQRRNTKGMKSLHSGVAQGMSFVNPNDDHFLVVTAKGYCNKIPFSSLPNIGRNVPGSNIIKLSAGDAIHSVHSISLDTKELVYTDTDGIEGSVDISNIPVSSSVSKGVKGIKMKKGVLVLSAYINN